MYEKDEHTKHSFSRIGKRAYLTPQTLKSIFQRRTGHPFFYRKDAFFLNKVTSLPFVKGLNNQERSFWDIWIQTCYIRYLEWFKREILDWVTKLNRREKFKVRFSFLMAYPKPMVPVMSLYIYDVCINDIISDEKIKFDSIISLISMKTSTSCIKPHQRPKRLRIHTIRHRNSA